MSESTSQLKIGAALDGSFEQTTTTVKRKLSELGGSANSTGKSLAGMGDGTAQSAQKIESATKSMISSIQRTTAATEAGNKSTRAYQESLARIRGVDVAALKPYLDQLDAAKAKQLTAASAAKSYETSLGGIKSAAIAAGAALASIGLVFGKLVSVQREFDVLNSSLITVTGSSAAAAREMEWIKTFAKETPFGLAQATQGFVKMKALGLDPTRASLTSFGNTASAMGKDLNQMIEAVADASTGEFERLKEFGIKARKSGDDVSLTFQGVTTTIGNSAREITKYLEDLGNVEFAGAMAERAKTLDGAISELADTWDELFRTVNTNNTGSIIYDSITLATGAITDATAILSALTVAAADNAKETGAMTAIQGGIATVFETVAVVGANLKYVLVGIGSDIGGLAAQVGQAAQFNFAGVRAIREQMVEDAISARAEIDATTERILGARDAAKELASYNTRNASAQNDPRRLDLGAQSGAIQKTAAIIKASLSDYDKLIAKLGSDLPKAAAEAEAAQHGYNKAQTEFLALAGSDVWAKFSATQKSTVASLFEGKIASEQAGDAAKAHAKALKDASESAAKYIDSLNKSADGIGAQLQKLQDEEQALQLSASANITLAEAIQEVEIARLRETQAQELSYGNEAAAAAIQREIDLRRELAKSINSKDGREAQKKYEEKAAEAALKVWEKSWEETDRLGREVFVSWATEGGNAAEKIGDALKSALLSAIYEATIRPIAFQIFSTVAGGSPGGGLGGLAGGANNLSNIGSLAGGATAFSGAFSAGAALGIDAFGAGVSMMGSATGVSSFMAGAGQALGALGPVGWVALGLGALGMLGGGYTSTQSTGYARRKYGADGSLITSETDGNGIGEAGKVLDGIYKDYAAIQKSLGAKGGADITYNSNTGREGKDPQFYLKTGNYDSGEIQKNSANVSLAVSRVMLTALQDSELPKYLQGAFDGLTAGTMSAEEIQAVIGNAQALKQFNDTLVQLPFAKLADMSYEATQKLIGFSGGLEQLVGNLASYYQNFYSPEEQRAQTVKNIKSKLDAAGGTWTENDIANASREQFRAALEDIGRTMGTDSELYAALLSVNAAFASITPAAKSAAEATKEATKVAAAALSTSANVAYAALERAIAAQTEVATVARDVAAEQVDAIKSVFETLKSNVDSLYGSVASTAALQAAQGNAFIDNALSTALTTGYLPDNQGLSDAIGAARSGVDSGVYASQADSDFARLVLAAKLKSLQDVSGDQLSVADQALDAAQAQVDSLAKILENAKSQLDVAMGIDTSILSVADAVALVNESIRALMALQFPETGGATDSGAGGVVVGGGIVGGAPTNGGKPAEKAGAFYKEYNPAGTGVIRQEVTDAAEIARLTSINSAVNTLDFSEAGKAGSVASLYALAQQYGVSQADLATATGYHLEDIKKLFSGAGIPAFAVGTNYVPRDMLAQIHEGEAIVPKAYNPAAGGNDELVTEIRALRAEVAALKSTAQQGNAIATRSASALEGNQSRPLLVEIA